jgi:hypothetical protein
MSKAFKRPVFAGDDILSKYSFARASQETESDVSQHSTFTDNLTHANWKFTSSHNKILNESGLAELTKTIKEKLAERFVSLQDSGDVSKWIEEDSLNVNGCKLHVPPNVVWQ